VNVDKLLFVTAALRSGSVECARNADVGADNNIEDTVVSIVLADIHRFQRDSIEVGRSMKSVGHNAVLTASTAAQ